MGIYLIGWLLAIIVGLISIKITEGQVTIRDVIGIAIISLFSYLAIIAYIIYGISIFMKSDIGNKKLF